MVYIFEFSVPPLIIFYFSQEGIAGGFVVSAEEGKDYVPEAIDF